MALTLFRDRKVRLQPPQAIKRIPDPYEILKPSDRKRQTHHPLLAAPSKRRHDDARTDLFDDLSRDTSILLLLLGNQ